MKNLFTIVLSVTIVGSAFAQTLERGEGYAEQVLKSQTTAKNAVTEIKGVSSKAKQIIVEAIGEEGMHQAFLRNIYHIHNTLIIRYQDSQPTIFGMGDPDFYIATVDTDAIEPKKDGESIAVYLERALREEVVTFEDNALTLSEVKDKYQLPKGHDKKTTPGYVPNKNRKIPCNPHDGTGCDDDGETKVYDDGSLHGQGQ